jgi:ketosteroid isomerase-like protein
MTAPTMTDRPTDIVARNAALLAEGYAAFGRGEMDALGRLFSPTATWHVQRLGRLSGDHVGFPAVLQFFADSMQLTQGTFRVTPIEILANAQGAAAVVRSEAQRNGRTLDDRQIHHFRVDDGIVAEVWQYVGADADAFWD